MITPERGENFIIHRSETSGIVERAVVRMKEETSGMNEEDEARVKGWKNKIEEILSHEIAGQYTEQKAKGSSETDQHEGLESHGSRKKIDGDQETVEQFVSACHRNEKKNSSEKVEHEVSQSHGSKRKIDEDQKTVELNLSGSQRSKKKNEDGRENEERNIKKKFRKDEGQRQK